MIGQTLGHYRILEKIGAGGMGEVYRAHDERLDRDVALKVLPPASFADPTARARLLQEARTASKLNHPHICTIHEVGEANGQIYVAMELIDGQPLSALTTREALSLEQTIRYGVQMADGLAHAHERGVVHRDLKPSNIKITPQGRVKVLDFGLAKLQRPFSPSAATESSADATTTAGTLPYMAPEQLRGEPADSRSDIWALGCVLYEMLAGQRPFRAKTGFELSAAILRETPGPLPANVPAELRAVVEHCLAKHPGERYQQVAEVRAALEVIASGTAIPRVRLKAGVSRRLVAVSIAAVLLMAAAVALTLGHLRERFFGTAKIESLAVLPMENLSGDPEQEYFADGMTDALITELSKMSGLRVISRTSVMRYKGTDKPLPMIAGELDVDTLVQGSVVRSGNRVRVTAQLIALRPERHLWADNFDRELVDILALHTDVARAIASEIRVQVTPLEQASMAHRQQVIPAAYEAYLRGRFHFSRATGEELRKAREYFEQAVEMDPKYAPAYLGLADFYAMTYELPPEVAGDKAKEYAQKALSLDPNLAEAHITLGIIQYTEWDWAGAERQFRRALELNPGSTEAHRMYANYLITAGRKEEALAEVRTARAFDPLSVQTHTAAGWVAFLGRQYDEAIQECKRALDLEPDSANAHDCLGSAYLGKEMHEQAIEECRKATTLSAGDPDRLVCLGRAYAAAGNTSEARRVLRELQAAAGRKHVPPYFLGILYAALGDNDQAFAWLEKSYRARDPYLVFIKVSPAADPLRGDPRFGHLLQRLGLPP